MNGPRQTGWLCSIGWLSLVGSAIAYSPSPALAQLTPDTTLGSEASTVGSGTVNDLPVQLIEGGALRGSNLFHSFGEFNVEMGEAVYFGNPVGIENILSRVTDGKISTINGRLGVDGSANLFLLNPNGIVFGPSAQLDIAGSFAASTGNSFTFADGSEFSAVTPEDSLLSLSVPLGVQLNAPAQGDIVNDGNLEVGAGESLTLFGNSIENNGQMEVRGGGEIVLTTPQTVGSAVVVNGGQVDTSVQAGDFTDGGDIRITTHDLTVQNDGVITANTNSQGNSGRIAIAATGDIMVDGEQSAITSQVNEFGTGNSGGISLATQSLSVLNAGEISASTFGSGNSGQLEVRATERVSVDGFDSHITSRVEETSTGNSGGIVITTGDLSVLNGALIGAETWGEGNSGRIEISATGEVTVGGQYTFISSRIDPGSTGNSGGISIAARNLSVLSYGEISASTRGEGNAGLVEIAAAEAVRVDGPGSYITSRVDQSGTGNSGGISITARDFWVLNGGIVGADTLGEGNSGLLKVIATDQVFVEDDGSTVSSRVTSDATGNSGGITITTGNLSVLNGAVVSASTFGEGNSGQVRVEATDEVVVDGSSSFIASQVGSNATGDSGGITISTNNLSVLNDSSISASTFGEGNSGPVRIEATDKVVVDSDGAGVYSQVNSNATGDSGGIDIMTTNLSVLNDAIKHLSDVQRK